MKLNNRAYFAIGVTSSALMITAMVLFAYLLIATHSNALLSMWVQIAWMIFLWIFGIYWIIRWYKRRNVPKRIGMRKKDES